MSDRVRRQALEQIRSWAYSRVGVWVLWIHLAGKPRGWRIPWPEGQVGRGEAWEQIEMVLLGSDREGELRGRQVGTPRSQTTVIPWPGPADLFGEPVAGEPEVVRQDATGEQSRQPAELPGLAVQYVTLTTPPRKANRECARAILKLLYQTQKRHTAADLALALEKDSGEYPWSDSVVEASCSWLRREGAVDNARDGMGVGYGLIKWEINPCGE